MLNNNYKTAVWETIKPNNLVGELFKLIVEI